MPKLPSAEGLKRARQRFKESLRQEPSDELVQIVEETLIEAEKEERKKLRKPEKAAKDPSTEAGI